MTKQTTLTISPPDSSFADTHVRPDKCARIGCHYTKVKESDFCAACVARQLVDHSFSKETCNNLTAYPDHSRDEDCASHVVDHTCLACGAYHGDPCPSCSQRAYHARGCPEVTL